MHFDGTVFKYPLYQSTTLHFMTQIFVFSTPLMAGYAHYRKECNSCNRIKLFFRMQEFPIPTGMVSISINYMD
jgi:hypothetical protein